MRRLIVQKSGDHHLGWRCGAGILNIWVLILSDVFLRKAKQSHKMTTVYCNSSYELSIWQTVTHIQPLDMTFWASGTYWDPHRDLPRQGLLSQKPSFWVWLEGWQCILRLVYVFVIMARLPCVPTKVLISSHSMKSMSLCENLRRFKKQCFRLSFTDMIAEIWCWEMPLCWCGISEIAD